MVILSSYFLAMNFPRSKRNRRLKPCRRKWRQQRWTR